MFVFSSSVYFLFFRPLVLRFSANQALLAYEERELPRLKEEKPGLKLRQYKEMIFQQVRVEQAWAGGLCGGTSRGGRHTSFQRCLLFYLV